MIKTMIPLPEALIIDRICADLYPLQDSVSLADVKTFGKYVDGRDVSVSVAATRNNLRQFLDADAQLYTLGRDILAPSA